MALKLVTDSTEEPVSLSEVKTHLRVDSTNEDSLIGGQITASRTYAEEFTRRSFVTQSWRLTLDDWPPRDGPIELPRSPLANSSNLSVNYFPSTGGGTLTVDSTNYITDDQSDHPRVVLKSTVTEWADEDLRDANAVQVEFDAGYGASSDVPQPLKSAVLLLCGHLHENRQAVVPQRMSKLPIAVESLLWTYRVPGVPDTGV